MKTHHIDLKNGIHLHVRDVGEGPVTLLLHGWAISGAVWDPFVDRWPADAGRVLVPDLRGTGWSTKPRTGYMLDAYADDILRLMDALELSDVALVGHSMGGAIAQKVALARPEALRKLVLLASVPASGVPLDADQTAFFRSLGGHRAGGEQVLGMTMAVPPEPALMERMVRDTATVLPECFDEAFDAWRTADFGDAIGGIQVPTVVVGCAGDQVLSPAILQQTIVDPIPGATMVLVPKAGHYPQAETPDAFAEVMLGALG